MTPRFTRGLPVIVTPEPGNGPAYAAKFDHYSNGCWVYVRGPQGLHAVPEGTVTPRVLGLGDDKAVRHGVKA